MNTSSKEAQWILKEKYDGNENTLFFEDLQRLENGEPVDYIIGHRPFLGASIDLSYRPLIPREETEYWTKNAINTIHEEYGDEVSFLDIFAGSGCIGISVLEALPQATGDFADVVRKNILQIEHNLEKNNISRKRFNVFQSDVFENIPIKKYQCIFANPPYIPEENYKKLDASVKDFEPKRALFAEDNGLFFIKKTLERASDYLADDGRIFIEIDDFQKSALEDFLSTSDIWHGEFLKDQFHAFRTLLIQKKKQ